MAGMPHFVLLYHDCPPQSARPSHWDLMLESGDTLRTWALENLPREWHVAHARTVERYPHCPPLTSGNEVMAEQLGNHRRDYLDFEGELSDDRGRVIRVAAGRYASESETPTCWQLSLAGDGATGQFRINRSDEDGTRWILTSS